MELGANSLQNCPHSLCGDENNPKLTSHYFKLSVSFVVDKRQEDMEKVH